MPMWRHALMRMLTAVTLVGASVAGALIAVAAPPGGTPPAFHAPAPVRIARELPVPLPPVDSAGGSPPVEPANPLPLAEEHLGPDLTGQTPAAAAAKSQGCISCHTGVGDMHRSPNVHLGCTDCHGGNADALTKQAAHIHPKECDAWPGSANPVRSYTLLNQGRPNSSASSIPATFAWPPSPAAAATRRSCCR